MYKRELRRVQADPLRRTLSRLAGEARRAKRTPAGPESLWLSAGQRVHCSGISLPTQDPLAQLSCFPHASGTSQADEDSLFVQFNPASCSRMERATQSNKSCAQAVGFDFQDAVSEMKQ